MSGSAESRLASVQAAEPAPINDVIEIPPRGSRRHAAFSALGLLPVATA